MNNPRARVLVPNGGGRALSPAAKGDRAADTIRKTA